jgi:hypothetical protein
MALAMPGPRSFQGRKDATVDEFFASYAHQLSTPDDENVNVQACARFVRLLKVRAICDLGGLQRMTRSTFLERIVRFVAIELTLDTETDLDFFVDAIEDVLDFKFIMPRKSNGVNGDLVVKPKKQELTSVYAKKDDHKLGAMLKANGTLDEYVIDVSMFPQVKTANVKLEEITDPEYVHILDRLWVFTLVRTGRVNVDRIWREHLGGQANKIFPNRGFTARSGKPRCFIISMQWRASNARKSGNSTTDEKGNMSITYKKDLAISRGLLDKDGLTIVDEKKFPLQLTDALADENEFKFQPEQPPALAPPKPLLPDVAGELTWHTPIAEANPKPLAMAVATAYPLPATLPPAVQAFKPMPASRKPMAPLTVSTTQHLACVDYVCSQKRLAEHAQAAATEAAPKRKRSRVNAKKPKAAADEKAAVPIPMPDMLSERTEPVRALIFPLLLSLLHLTRARPFPCSEPPVHRWGDVQAGPVHRRAHGKGFARRARLSRDARRRLAWSGFLRGAHHVADEDGSVDEIPGGRNGLPRALPPGRLFRQVVFCRRNLPRGDCGAA